MKRLTLLLLLLSAALCARAAEDNNPCLHKNMEFKEYVGGVTVVRTGDVPEQFGGCTRAVDVCGLAKTVVSLNDTFKEKWECKDCHNYTDTRDPDPTLHHPELTASLYPGGGLGPVTGVANYVVRVTATGCHPSCPASNSVDVTIKLSHQPEDSFECDVSVTWYVGPGAVPAPNGLPASPQLCSLTQAQAQAQAYKLADVNGTCKKTTICTACQQTLQSGVNNLHITDSATRITNGYRLSRHVKCHSIDETRDYVISLTHDDMELGSGIRQNCDFVGIPTEHSVQEESISIPVNDSQTFNVGFSGELGNHEFRTYHCSRCQETFNFPTNDRPNFSHQPVTILPPSVGSGILQDPQPEHPYAVDFPTVGETEVKFVHECKGFHVDTYTHQGTGLTFTNFDVPGCSDSKAGEFIFDVKVMTVDTLTVTSEHETGGESVFELPELDENDPEPTENYYVRAYKPAKDGTPAEWETVLKATPTPSGDWPDGKPTWKRYPAYAGTGQDPLLIPVEDEPGKKLCHPEACGAYVFVARCEAGNETDPDYAKSLALYVVDPTASVKFESSLFGVDQDGKNVLRCAACTRTSPIKLHLKAEPNGIPDGIEAKVSFENPDNPQEKVFEIYKDKECTEKADPSSLSWTVDSEQDENGTYINHGRNYYIKVLGPENDDDLITEFKVKIEYGLGGKLKSEGEDSFKVLWDNNCASGTCSGSDGASFGMDADGPKLGLSFGPGLDGKTGGAIQLKGRNGNALSALTFAYAPDTKVKLSGNLPLRIMTGRYQTEFSYDAEISSGCYTVCVIKQYLSDNMNPESAATGVPIYELRYGFELFYGDNSIMINRDNIYITSTRYVNGIPRSQNTYLQLFYNASIPGISGTFSKVWRYNSLSGAGLCYFGVQDYTDGGIAYRREAQSVYDSYYGRVLKTTDTIKRQFPWGYSVVSETDGDGTTTYEYYDTGMLKKVTHPSGETESYTYDAETRMLTATTVRGDITTVTNYAYSKDPVTGGRVTDATSTVGATEISRSRNISHAFPGANPDVSTRYGEGSTALTTSTWYVYDTESPFYNRPLRQVNPDGTETNYTYVRENSIDTVTVESGVFSGNTLTRGTRNITVSNQAGVTVSTASYAIEGGQTVQTAGSVNTAFDEFGRPTATQYLDGSTSSRTYGCCGVESETDRDGIVTTYAYDNFQRVSHTIRDGITTLYTYDGAGQQTAVTVKGRDNGEITTGSEYTNGVLTASVDALGNRTTFSRNRSGGTTTETQTNPDGGTQVTTYYLGQMTGVSGTALHPQSYEYGANWQRTLPQNVTAYSDLLGREYRTVYADNSEAVQYYNVKSQVVKSVTPAGRVTLYEYDTLGRQTTQAIDMNANNAIDAADIVTTTAYGYATYGGKTVSVTTATRSQGADSKVISVNRQSLDGLESWSTDAAGLTTYSKLERLGSGATRQTVTQPTGVKTVSETQNDRVTKVTTRASNNTVFSEATYTYDQFNRVSQVVEKDSAGNTINTTAMTYNAAGQVLTQTVNGQTTSYAYNVTNRTVTTTQPGNRVIVQESYPTGELKRISGADTYTQEWTWNPTWGQKATLTTWKDANTPQVTSWTYNNRGFNTAKQYADNNGPTYTYDADGLMLTRTWARGIVTTYAYDNAGRQTGYSYSDGVTPAVSTILNMLNQPTTITDAAGARSFTYNSNYRLANETNPVIVNGVMNYTYDAYGRRTGMNLTDGTVRAQAGYTYDTAGRVATVGDGGDTLTYAYAPGTSRVASTAWTTATGNNTAYTYDSYHRLTGIAVNNTPVYGYTLNDKDQRTAATLENGDTWAYTYDTLGQLTGAVKKDAQDNTLNTMSYVYDLIGNRTAAAEDANTFNYTSNLVNQYTQINQSIPTYDTDGNMLTYNGWSFTWNGENRLVIAENTATGMRVEADYDYMGRRFKKKVYENNVLTSHSKFAYDGYKQIAEFDALNNNTQLASYLWQPVGMDVPLIRNNAEYYIVDGNKNVIELRDATGAVTDTYAYDPFGKATHTGSSDNPFQFSSEHYDTETDLVYYNYRYYSPTLGRWIKRDPIDEEGGVNKYVFVHNNITSFIDYLGLLTKQECTCAYWNAINIFVDLRDENPYKSWNQLSGYDCYSGSAELRNRLLSDKLVPYAFNVKELRAGKFLGRSHFDLASIHFDFATGLFNRTYYRFVRMHSVVGLMPKGECTKWYKEQAFDFLEQLIYPLGDFYKEFPLKVSFGSPGYYLVYPPPSDNILKPGQSTPYLSTNLSAEIFNGLTGNIFR